MGQAPACSVCADIRDGPADQRVALINADTARLAVLTGRLGDAGYEPHPFRAVRSACERVRALAPHAIVLDIPLTQPATNWEVLALCRLDPRLSRTPLIVCSADTHELRDQAPTLERHGCVVLPKPFTPAALLQMLAQVVR